MADYKLVKEAFVADNLGASIWSINLTSATALFGYALYALVIRRIKSHPLVDYLTTVLPLLLATTLLESQCIILNAILLSLTPIILLVRIPGRNAIPAPDLPRQDEKVTRNSTSSAGRLPFLSVYRAHMMIMTIICILAVDFQVFPRWQGKCEDFGTSLMDVGVGSFVFSLGIVSLRSYRTPTTSSSMSRIIKSLRKSTPLFVLGLARVLMVKGSDYPEHVTEYGVHWNFFFTLALLPIFGELLWPLRERGMNWTILASLISISHQLALTKLDLQGYVLSTERLGIVGLNKEGLVSLPGYLAIYLLGLGTGEQISNLAPGSTPPGQTTDTQDRSRKYKLSIHLLSGSIAWWVVLGVTAVLNLRVSRRMSNLPYVLWIAAFNTTFLLGYLYIDMTLFSPSTTIHAVPPLLDAVNANGLVVFLVANLLTGLVNVSVKTMYMGTWSSMSILVLYTGVVCGVAWYGRRYRFTILR